MSIISKNNDQPASRVRQILDSLSLPSDATVGVALSGGADSTALLHIARSLGLRIMALHCNFGLRGDESDRDERFVTDLCRSLGIELSVIRFDVASRRRQTGESTEMACRSLRYEWFAKKAAEHRLPAILLGHHRDDNVETFMLNAIRGSGLRGVAAIPPRRDIFVRPLLGVSRQEILNYLDRHGLEYVTDSTNLKNDYRRNRIRNLILPVIERSFPDAAEHISKSIRNLNDDLTLLDTLVAEKRSRYVDSDGTIRLRELLDNEATPLPLLYHILRGRLDRVTITNIVNSADQSGKYFTARDGERYLLDRGRLIPLTLHEENPREDYQICLSRDRLLTGQSITVAIPQEGIEITVDPLEASALTKTPDRNYAWFDISLLDISETLTLRHPLTGDRITPFGMTRSRLLSDIFAEKKISLIDKKRQWVITCGKQIIWLPGVKNANTAPVIPASSKILRLYFRKTNKNS